MTLQEYKVLQDRFSAKLKNHNGRSTNRESEYNNGILACKSILKEIFERYGEIQIKAVTSNQGRDRLSLCLSQAIWKPLLAVPLDRRTNKAVRREEWTGGVFRITVWCY